MEELTMGLKAGLNLFVRTVFNRGTQKTASEVPQTVQRMTKVMTDSSTGIVRMERNINRNGKEALAKLEVFPNGSRKMTIVEGGDNTIWRTAQVTREKGASVFGGDKVTVDKDYTKYWCYGEETKLVKEYNPKGVLEHKELNYHKNIGNETFIDHRAVQDRVYDEYALKSGSRDMLANPNDSKYVKHALDDKNNYHQFADGSSTNYTRTVQAKEQAAIDAAKKAEAEAIAAKEAAEKAAVELRAKQPRINIAKALNKDINELTVKETKLADGTIERTFTDPASGKVLAKTQDMGLLHKEWIYGGKADMIYMKQVGSEKPYIVAKKGNYTQIDYVKTNYNWKLQDGKYHKDYISEQYYNDGVNSLKRTTGGDQAYSDASGRVTVYDSTAGEKRAKYPDLANDYPDYPIVYMRNGEAMHNPYCNNLTNAQKQANRFVKELDNDAQKNVLDLKDLFSGYKA